MLLERLYSSVNVTATNTLYDYLNILSGEVRFRESVKNQVLRAFLEPLYNTYLTKKKNNIKYSQTDVCVINKFMYFCKPVFRREMECLIKIN